MAFDKVFKLTSEGDIELSPFAKKVPEYKAIIVKKVFVAGDSEGKKKLWNERVFIYIYHLVDPRSECKNLSAIERRVKALERAGLEPDFKDTQIVLEAINRYKEDIPLNATANAYYASEKALYSVAEDTKWLLETSNNVKEILRAKIKELNTGIIKLEDTGLLKEMLSCIESITKVEKDISNVIKTLPDMKKVLDELAAKYSEEGGGQQRIHGGGTLGNRED